MSPALVLAAVLAPPPDAPAAVKLAVRPAAAPTPALRYALLPEVRELNPGNPVQWYIRCFAEQRNFFFGKEATEERAKYRTMPLDKLPAKDLRNYGGSALTQADWAARLDTPDWEVLKRVQTEGTEMVLAELEPLRILGYGLQVRFRGEVARHEWDAAVGTAKTMLTLARHLGECPVSAANRLGLDIAGMALDTLEEMLQQPGCPNLYWAFTDLPAPLVDIRKGVQGDRATSDAELKAIRADAAMTAEELDELVGGMSGRIGFARERAGLPPLDLRGRITEMAKDTERTRKARVRLIDAGSPSAAVWGMPALQVLLLDEKRAYELRRDEELKLVALLPRDADRLRAGKAAGLFGDLVPRVAELREAQARVEQRIAALRCVEAIRLHAAGHDGKPPAKLEDLAVPVPADPFTGKPFRYEVAGGVAHLRGEPSKGDAKSAAWAGHYEITIGK